MDADKPKKNPQKDQKGRFVEGNCGGGRKLGSKNKYGEEVRAFLKEKFLDGAKKKTIQAILDDPDLFLQALGEATKVTPKEDSVEVLTPEPLTIKIQDETQEEQKS